MKTYSLTDLPARMQAKVTVLPDGCWYWTGAINSKGYGQWAVDGVSKSTHRVAYESLAGPIPDGMTIDHLCQIKRCCNPAHLEVVSRTENSLRYSRNITHCPQGHPLSGDNLIIKKNKLGHEYRNCRECANARRRDARRCADVAASRKPIKAR